MQLIRVTALLNLRKVSHSCFYKAYFSPFCTFALSENPYFIFSLFWFLLWVSVSGWWPLILNGATRALYLMDGLALPMQRAVHSCSRSPWTKRIRQSWQRKWGRFIVVVLWACARALHYSRYVNASLFTLLLPPLRLTSLKRHPPLCLNWLSNLWLCRKLQKECRAPQAKLPDQRVGDALGCYQLMTIH